MYSVTPTAEARLGQLPDRTVNVAPEVVPYLNLYPLPNGRDYGDGTGEFIAEGVTSSREDYVTAKMDAVLSNRLRQSVRYTFDDALTSRPELLNIYRFLDDSHYHILHSETQFNQSTHTLHSLRGGFSRVWNRPDIQSTGFHHSGYVVCAGPADGQNCHVRRADQYWRPFRRQHLADASALCR